MTSKNKETANKTALNGGKFQKGNKCGKKFSDTYQPSGEAKSLGKAVQKLFKEVTQEKLWELQGEAIEKMAQWVIQKLDNLDNLSASELEKIQKFLEFLRDSSGQKPVDKQTSEIIGNLGVQKIFITPEEKAETDKHIDDVINGQS